MSWEDRLNEAAYRSPGGTRTTFKYRDVTRTVAKNTTGFNFPDADGTLVQDLGHQGRRYPLRIYFDGADCDLEADAFELLLLERGVGVLEHPRYGHVDVVPYGEIKQSDAVVSAGNQSILEVTFWATVGTAYPTVTEDAADAAVAAVGDFQAVAAEEFANALDVASQIEEVTFKDQWESLVGTCTGALSSMAAASPVTLSDFNTVVDSINSGIDVLVAEPLTLAFQTINMITTPASAAAAIRTRLEGYANLADSILSTSSGRISTASDGTPQVIAPTTDNRADNALASRQVYAQGSIAGAVTAAMDAIQNDGFATQPQAINAAEQLFAQLDAVTNWLDDNYRAFDVVDVGGAYQSIVAAVAYAAGALVSESFNLKRERRITLTRNRSMFDLVAEYYGDLDQLDFFINTNNLTGSEILELPRGKEIVIYS